MPGSAQAAADEPGTAESRTRAPEPDARESRTRAPEPDTRESRTRAPEPDTRESRTRAPEPDARESRTRAPDHTRQADRRSRRSWLRRPWVGAALYAAFGIVLLFAYWAHARTLAASSNGAGQALQAWDMMHGNLLLRGWTLSDVSFYTTELPEYMLVEVVRGLNADTIHLAAAISYTLVVLLAGLVAKGRATGREGLVRLLVAVGIMLAPSARFGTYLLLSGPDHIGTHVPLLLIWLLIDRARPRWWVPIATGLLLIWAQIADPLVLFEGALPLAAACAIRAYRRRGPLSGQWYDLSMIAAAIVSAGAAKVVIDAIRHAGGFFVHSPIIAFAGPSVLTGGFWPKIESVLQVFGADFFGQKFGPGAVVAIVHLLGLALVVWAVSAGVRRLFGESELLVQLLAIAFVLVTAAYFFGVKPDANEIVGLLPIGAVLAGRLLTAPIRRNALIPALAAVLACYAVLVGVDAVHAPAPSGTVQISSWLQRHHLTYGLAGYWNANDITMNSGDRLQVRPVRDYANQVVSTLSESDAAWYNPRLHDATYVLWSRRCQSACVSLTAITDSYGKPAKTYLVGHFEVLVYRQNLLTNLPTLYWCGNVWPWATPGRPAPGPCS